MNEETLNEIMSLYWFGVIVYIAGHIYMIIKLLKEMEDDNNGIDKERKIEC